MSHCTQSSMKPLDTALNCSSETTERHLQALGISGASHAHSGMQSWLALKESSGGTVEEETGRKESPSK
jgi:hypothetical protein